MFNIDIIKYKILYIKYKIDYEIININISNIYKQNIKYEDGKSQIFKKYMLTQL